MKRPALLFSSRSFHFIKFGSKSNTVAFERLFTEKDSKKGMEKHLIFNGYSPGLNQIHFNFLSLYRNLSFL